MTVDAVYKSTPILGADYVTDLTALAEIGIEELMRSPTSPGTERAAAATHRDLDAAVADLRSSR